MRPAIVLLSLLLAATSPESAGGQRPDTVRTVPSGDSAGIRQDGDSATVVRDSVSRRLRAKGPRLVRAAPAAPHTGPPLSPRRAFLYSALLPGVGQARLDRPNAAGLFVTVEVLSLALAKRTGIDLRYAKAHAHDTVIAGYERNNDGTAVIDSKTGLPRPIFAENRYAGNRVKARRTQYEDWVAAIVFNHLLAGADAFISAQLWDLPAEVGASGNRRAVRLQLSLRW